MDFMGTRTIRLILNADDFGKSQAVNLAVISAHKAGTLTSCSLMVSGDAFEDAVKLAKENPNLAVGIHLVTVQGRSVLPHSEIPHLVDRQGFFPNDPTIAGLRYQFSRAARRELSKELTAQMEKFHAAGLSPSHIDSHLHMHIHPVIFHLACELGERFGVKHMRVPQDDFFLGLRYDFRNTFPRFGIALIFLYFCLRMKRVLQKRGFGFADRVYGHLFSGKMSLPYILFILNHMRSEANEIYFHPSLAPFSSRPESEGGEEQEYRVLVSDTLRERLKGADFILSKHSDLRRDSRFL